MIPALVLIIAPIALMIAVSHTLNKLATDSEIIVMNAAGISPIRLFRPFLIATAMVALLVAFIAAYLAPDGMRRIKQWDAEITADVLANILQPGRFSQLEQNLTIRIRERLPGGVLAGVFVDDRRDPKERISIMAERGTVLKNERGSFLVLQDGHLERFETDKRDPILVSFERYAFDMSKFSNRSGDITYGIRERYLWELISPDPNDPMYKQLPGQFFADLHDRLMSPIYPFAFAALTFAFLGTPVRACSSCGAGGSRAASPRNLLSTKPCTSWRSLSRGSSAHVPYRCANAPPQSMSATSRQAAPQCRATRILTTSLSARLISAGEPAPSIITKSFSARKASSAAAICGHTWAERPRHGMAVNAASTLPSNTTWLCVSASGLSSSGFMRTSGTARAASA